MPSPQPPPTNRHFLELARSTALLKQENVELHRLLGDAQRSMEAMLVGVQQQPEPLGDDDHEDLRFFRAREPHIQSLIASVAAEVGVRRAMDQLRRFAAQWTR
jgi:hypothetical protein